MHRTHYAPEILSLSSCVYICICLQEFIIRCSTIWNWFSHRERNSFKSECSWRLAYFLLLLLSRASFQKGFYYLLLWICLWWIRLLLAPVMLHNHKNRVAMATNVTSGKLTHQILASSHHVAPCSHGELWWVGDSAIITHSNTHNHTCVYTHKHTHTHTHTHTCKPCKPGTSEYWEGKWGHCTKMNIKSSILNSWLNLFFNLKALLIWNINSL